MGYDISQITDYLYISARPERKYVEEFRSLNVRLILSTHWLLPAKVFRQPPFQLLWLPMFDSPLIPIPLALLNRGVQVALAVIQQGGKVLVHCRYGIHRSVAMGCCVLIGNGFTAPEAMEIVKNRREVADPYRWYIQSRIEKFEAYWLKSKNETNS
jgi:protein-tyrosine phosphatase